MVQQSATLVHHGSSWCNMVQHGATLVQHGATWFNMVQHGATWCNMVQHGATADGGYHCTVGQNHDRVLVVVVVFYLSDMGETDT